MKIPFLAIGLILGASPALAHESNGPNGGQQVDAGSMHVEVVAKAMKVDVFVSDGAGKPVDASSYKGLAILVVAGKPARIALTPAGADRMTGVAPADIANPVKGAVQITTPAGSTVQAKFN